MMSSGDTFWKWSTDAEVVTDCGLTEFQFQIFNLVQFDLWEENQAVEQTMDPHPALKSTAYPKSYSIIHCLWNSSEISLQSVSVAT